MEIIGKHVQLSNSLFRDDVFVAPRVNDKTTNLPINFTR